MAKKEYGNESISMLKGADRVRLRPAVIFGSDGLEGVKHAVFEVISNSLDEARSGHGNKINVTKYADGSIEVEDFGRGCPVDFNKNEDRYNWELVFCELYAGGKYGANDYEYSLGLNGLGLASTQFASEYMTVTVKRDSTLYNLEFKQGENVSFDKKPVSDRKTGTKIKWKPDLEVFTEIDIPIEWFRDTLKKQAIVNPNILFVLNGQEKFIYENGIADYINEIVPNPLTSVQLFSGERSGRDRNDKPEYKVKLNVAFTFSNTVKLTEHYHNSSFLEYGGSPDKATRQAFTSFIDNFLKSNNKYQKNESKINFADIEECLIFISSNFSTQTSYENQTKKAINNKFIYDYMVDFLKQNLEVYFTENPIEATKICEQILVNKRSRENAEKTRLNLKKKLAGNIDLSNMVPKFVDCRSKDTDRRELYIVEGDSALGAVKLARDAEFQAVIPVRGKILNCLKADYAKIFKSDIIIDLLKVLGCGVEIKAKENKELHSFNLDNLKWNKIVICTDADVDGFQIRTLILTMLFRLTPTVIQQGYVYIAETPLFEITAKDKTYFAYTESEKNNIVKKLSGKYTIQRSKGLGENEPEMMSLTTMNPDTRRLIKIMPADIENTAKMFDLLLGDNLAGRKEYIAMNGEQYVELADVS
ncbi:MAG: DNA topoisomerase [Oscillospiraceae bacterium]|nr:DNA topoisomerase [Oscillospiraceae bacterium]